VLGASSLPLQRNKVPLEKRLTGPGIPAFYGTRMFITVFTTACHIFYPKPDHSRPQLTTVTERVFLVMFTHTLESYRPFLSFSFPLKLLYKVLSLANCLLRCLIVLCVIVLIFGQWHFAHVTFPARHLVKHLQLCVIRLKFGTKWVRTGAN
jgi:hypothetical protein